MTVESGGTSPALLLGAIIGLVCLAVLIFVITLGYLRGQNNKQKGTRRREDRQESAVPRDEQEVEPAEAPASEPGASTRPGEVMRVIRDSESGRVLVEVGARRYGHIREIEDAQVGRRVLWAIADLIRFTGGMATNSRAVRSASELADWEEDLPKAAPGRRAAWPVPGTAPSDAGASIASPANLSQTVTEFFRRGLSPASSANTAPEPGTFVDQIEAILQVHLQKLETPLPYEVHVSAGPEQRLQIRVGREVYGSVDEVADPQVRALIQGAVDEWERRS